MKRQLQKPGVRFWSGNDLLELQAEGFKVLDGFLSQFGDLVITGVVPHADGTISAGLVSLDGMIMPFAGGTAAAFPAYLVVAKEVVERSYLNGATQPVAEIYTAQLVAQKPSVANYIVIREQGAPCFPVGDILSAPWSANNYDDFTAPGAEPEQPEVETQNLEFLIIEDQLPEVDTKGEYITI